MMCDTSTMNSHMNLTGPNSVGRQLVLGITNNGIGGSSRLNVSFSFLRGRRLENFGPEEKNIAISGLWSARSRTL